MKQIIYILVIITLCLNTVSAQERKINTNLEVGTLPGSVSINPDGSSSYAIPITTLPGRAGMEPAVALVYNSMSGNGSLGIGWSISGMQSITRGATDLYFEDVIDGVDFDENDQYYLNGQRLLKIGTNEYRTEQDGFSKVITYGTAGSGPKTFTVHKKNGIELQFGHTSNSRIEASGRSDVMFWRLNRIIDKRGNYIDYVYDESGHEGLIESIKYTGNTITGESPFNSIDFYYTDRYDNNTFYIYGSNIQQTKLLDRIETKYNNQLQNTYKLVYDESGINPKLTSVQPITKSGAKMNPTNFEWGDDKMLQTITNMQNIMQEDDYIMGDFNGDGKSDIIWYRRNVSNYSVDWQVFYGGEGGVYDSGESGTEWNFRYFQPGDFNGDGLDDILFVYNHIVSIMFSTGQQFDDLLIIHNTNYTLYEDHQFLNVDLNGNGKTEILLVKYNSPTKKGKSSYISNIIALEYNGVTFVSILDENVTDDGFEIEHDNIVGHIDIFDMNSDGKSDIIWNNDENTGLHHIKELQGELLVNTASFNESFFQNDNKLFGDFNGDGITDIFIINSASVNVYLFDGKNTWISGPTISAPGDPVELYHEYYDYEFLAGDFNGDNMYDVSLIFKERYVPPPHHGDPEFLGTHVSTYYSFGSGTTYETDFYSNLEYGFYAPGGSSYYDFNGDGSMDVMLDYSEENRKIMFFRKNEKSNLTHTFTNGLGHQSSVEYDYLTNNEIYEKGSGSEYPIMDIQPPMAVAIKSLSQNGEGGFFESNYSYKKALVHLKGKGMLGFGEFIALNNTANTISEIKFEIYDKDASGNPFYFFIYPSETSLYSTTTNDRDRNLNINEKDLDIKNKLLSRTINTMDVISTSNNAFNYMSITTQTISHRWDNNSANSHISTVLTKQDKNNIDLYGNSTQSSSKVYTTTNINGEPLMSTQTTITYKYDISNWIVNRPKNINTTTTTDGGSTRSEVSCIYYNKYEVGGNGVKGWPLVKSAETTPEGDNDFKNTTSFEYDKYGNTTKKTLEALDLSGNEPYQTIVKTIDYEYASSNGYLSRFLTKSTINEGPGYETTYTYYPKKGQIATVKNPAGLQTSYSYDDFGRLELRTFADGTTTESQLNWVADGNMDAPRGSIYYTWSKSSGTGVNQIFYNFLNKQIRVTGEGLTARQKIFVDTKYDTKGLIIQVSEPFFAENPPDEHDERKWTFFRHDRIGRPIYLQTPTNSYATIYNGLKTSVLDFSTRITKINTKNSLGQTIKVSDPSGDIDYTYYSTGLLHTTNALGLITTLSYDAAGNKATMTEPNSGTYTYKFSVFGELLEQTDAKGNITKIQYDGLGRPKTKNLNNDITTYKYNSASGTDGFGLIKEVRGHNGIYYTYQYDQLNRLEQETKLIDGNSFTSSLEYDSYSRVKTYTYPSDYKIDYLYTPETGIFYKIEDHHTGNMLYETGEINQRGQLLNYSLGNGLQTRKSYNTISGLIENINTGNIQNLVYTWDHSLGNMLSREDKTSLQTLKETFGYDDLLKSRLANWQVNTEELFEIDYKSNGNISTKSDVTINGNIVKGHYGYTSWDKPNAVISITLPQPEYVNNNDRQDITYTAFNKVSTILQDKNQYRYELDFTYGPDNQRKKTILYKDRGIEKIKYFVGGNYEVEYDDLGNQRILHYLSAVDGLFAIYEWEDRHKKMYYIHKDHLGSYETITDEEGSIVEKLNFDPWGRRRNPDTWTFDNDPEEPLFDRGFTGHEHLDVFGLVNMNGRVYDPLLGRMLSPDPVLQAPANSQNYNRYTYAMNNPLKFVDPSGYNFEGYGDGHGNPLGGSSHGSNYNYDGSLNPGSEASTGMTHNQYHKDMLRNTAHEINRTNGASYGKFAWRGKRGYVNTWTGYGVSKTTAITWLLKNTTDIIYFASWEDYVSYIKRKAKEERIKQEINRTLASFKIKTRGYGFGYAVDDPPFSFREAEANEFKLLENELKPLFDNIENTQDIIEEHINEFTEEEIIPLAKITLNAVLDVYMFFYQKTYLFLGGPLMHFDNDNIKQNIKETTKGGS